MMPTLIRLGLMFLLRMVPRDIELSFSSPGHSPGGAIVLPPVLAAVSGLAKC